jgi:hypothetical protein
MCGVCGSSVTAERHIKRRKDGTKKAHVYYRCTGWKNSRRVCAYLREEELVRQPGDSLRTFKIDRRSLGLLVKELKKSSESEIRTAKERLATLIIEEKRLKNRLDQAYNDKLDGVISAEDYQEKASSWRDRGRPSKRSRSVSRSVTSKSSTRRCECSTWLSEPTRST